MWLAGIPPCMLASSSQQKGEIMHASTLKIVRSVAIGFFAMVLPAPSGAGEKPAKPPASPIIRTAQSGAWSAPAAWQGDKLPAANARVLIREGHRVVYDLQATEPIRSLTVSGTLSFAGDKDTRLDVGLIKIQAGEDCTEEGFACDAHGAP